MVMRTKSKQRTCVSLPRVNGKTSAEHLSMNSKPRLSHTYDLQMRQGLIVHNLSALSQTLLPVMEEVGGRGEDVNSPADRNISVTRDILKSKDLKALEEQNKLADANSKEAIKVPYAEVIKKGCESQVKPLLCVNHK